MVCQSNSVAGIFSREDRSTYDWLIHIVLNSWGVRGAVSVHISNNWSDFAHEVPKCSFAILFHSKTTGQVNVTNVPNSLYDCELEHLSRVLGKENVIVVIGNMEDSSAAAKDRILREQPDISAKARDLFLFKTIDANQAQPEGPTAEELQNLVRSIAWKCSCMETGSSVPGKVLWCSNSVAGIFSREKSTYDWLIRIVLNSRGVRVVRPIKISNNWSDFADEVPKCSFAFLFHSKSRGQVHVTDVNNVTNINDVSYVTHTLYNRELEHLSRVLGKENVIVVIGNMEDSSAAEKDRILREQPDISAKARDLFLFKTIDANQAQPEGPTAGELQNLVRSIAWKCSCKDPDVKRMVCTVIVVIFVIIAVILFYIFLHDSQ